MKTLTPDSEAYLAHLTFLQNITTWMRAISAICKCLCVAVTNILIVFLLVLDAGWGWYLCLLVPTISFGYMDVRYLGLELGFRNAYRKSVKSMRRGLFTPEKLHDLTPVGQTLALQYFALQSFSIWGMYIPLVVVDVGLIVFKAV